MIEIVTDLERVLMHYMEECRKKDFELNDLRKHVSEKDEKIRELEMQLSRFKGPIPNSSNSNTPSSQNPLQVKLKRTQSLREKSKKKSGGQPGHIGVTLEMVKEADESYACKPDFCTCCGESLSEVEGVISSLRQVVDLPLPIEPFIRNYAQYTKTCKCGCMTKGEFPKEATAPVSYGPNVEAAVAFLSTVQHISFKRITDVMRCFFNINLSQGTVQNILKRMRKNAFPAYESIRQTIEKSSVVGADETGMRVSGRNQWMWVFQTKLASFFHLDKSRGMPALEKMYPQGLTKATLVSDRHRTYFRFDVANHQVCLPHILRELVYLSELDSQQDWSTRMLELLRRSIHEKKEDLIDQKEKDEIRSEMNKLLEEDISHLDKKFGGLQRGLTRDKDFLFTFLDHSDVPSDNNASERALRPIKGKMKVAGTFRTDEGAQDFATLYTIVDTSKKNNQDPFLALRAVAQYSETE